MAGLATGCKTSDGGTQATRTAEADGDRNSQLLDALEREYAIGPRAARSLGYRLGWQNPTAGKDTSRISPQGDSVLLLSDDNALTRITADTGTTLWSTSVGSPVAEILGLNYLHDEQRIYVTRDSSILSLSSPTGVMVSKPGRSPVQSLQWIANTSPLVYGDYFIYGSRTGDLSWQAYKIGHPYRAYAIGDSIQVMPQLSGNIVITVATSGEIVALNADRISTMWRHELLDQIVAPPTIGASVVFVSSKDQYLRCFDLASGRMMWRALTESPLTTSPTLIGTSIYQQIPGSGLACYDAVPRDRFDGLRRWLSAEITGTVLTTRGDNLLTWDPDRRDLVVVSGKTGIIEERMHLPEVRILVTDNLKDGRLYTLDSRGRLDCLLPLN